LILIYFGVSSPQPAAGFDLCGWYFYTPLLAKGSFITAPAGMKSDALSIRRPTWFMTIYQIISNSKSLTLSTD
jgi:hypothetical protein